MCGSPALITSAMSREWGKVRRVIASADVVLEVLDARDPMRTRCPKVERLAERLGKKVILVINKADLVPRDVMERWRRVLSREHPTVYVSARERLGTRMLWATIRSASDKRPLTVAVVGYPNVGKSTVINYLKGRRAAGTSPVPGFTRDTKLVRAATWLRVVDTPGVIPVAGEVSEVDAIIKGVVRPEALDDPIHYALKFVEEALRKDPRVFLRTYGVKSRDPMGVIEELARRRGLLLKGGRLNLEEAARIIIRDWYSGVLVFYYTPEDYAECEEGEGPERSQGA